MKKAEEDRGQYRAIYSVLVDSPEFLSLSPEAKLVFHTLRLCQECNIACIFVFYWELMPPRTGYTAKRVALARRELEKTEWIITQDPVVWIRNGLRFNPSIDLSYRDHREGVLNILKSLPRLPILKEFCTYYRLPTPTGLPLDTLLTPSPTSTQQGVDSGPTQVKVKVKVQEEIDPPLKGPPLGGTPPASLKDTAMELIVFLNTQAGKNFPINGKAGEENLRWPLGRLKVGFTEEDCALVIRYNVKHLKGTDKEHYLNPKTLFRPNNFQNYLQEARRELQKTEEVRPPTRIDHGPLPTNDVMEKIAKEARELAMKLRGGDVLDDSPR